MKDIVWGTCWYNEPVEKLIEFLKNTISSLQKMGFNVVPVVFDARYVHNEKDIELIKKEIDNVKVILNHLNVFPNKNYGVALITNLAYELKIEHVAIIDPDWNIKQSNEFVEKIMNKLIEDNNDILIPNIKDASGRSNLLIGRTVIELFYPEYLDILQSVFPGAVAAKTNQLYKIVNDDEYHFDWGGEWDIISLAVNNKMKIASSSVEVVGVRHRSNASKMQDSFQIWKAIFSNKDIINRYENIKKFNIKNKEHRLYKLISDKSNILDIIDVINSNNPSKTEQQILYMILYPLALLMGVITTVPKPLDVEMPYDKKELYEIKDLAIYCMKLSLINSDIKDIYEKAINAKGEYFSKWNTEYKNEGLKEYEVI